MKRICSLISTIVLIVLALVAAALFVPKILGYEQYAVLSGSMEPTIPVGSVVCTKSLDESDALSVGDVITYQLGSGTLVTHRIVEINDDQTVTTQGDANNVEDAAPVAYGSIVGKYAFHIPYLGYITIYGKTPIGIAVICAILAILIISNFLPDILAEGKDEDDAHK